MYDAASTLSMQRTDLDALSWIIWCYRSPLSLPQQYIHTDSRSVSEDLNTEIPYMQTLTSPSYIPQTHRYHAVWANLEQKARKAGTYASWDK